MDKIEKLQGLKQEGEYMWKYGSLFTRVPRLWQGSKNRSLTNDRGAKMHINTTLALHRADYGYFRDNVRMYTHKNITFLKYYIAEN